MRKFMALIVLSVLAIAPVMAELGSAWGIDTDYDGVNELNLTSTNSLRVDGELLCTRVYTSESLSNTMQMWENPAAISSYVVYSVVVATAGVAYSTGYIVTTGFTVTPWPRTYGFSFNTGYSTQVAEGTVYIVGKNSLGNSVTETVSIKNCDVEYSSYAYCSFTSFLFKLTSADSIVGAGHGEQGQGTGKVSLNIGTGYKMGLDNAINAAGSVYFVNEAGTVTTTYTANATYSTIDFATDPNGSNEYYIKYKINSNK